MKQLPCLKKVFLRGFAAGLFELFQQRLLSFGELGRYIHHDRYDVGAAAAAAQVWYAVTT